MHDLTVLPEADYPRWCSPCPTAAAVAGRLPPAPAAGAAGVDTCLRVLTCILLENKLVLPVPRRERAHNERHGIRGHCVPHAVHVPRDPPAATCMMSAEQLLLAPTPYIIGLPASFLLYKKELLPPTGCLAGDFDANKAFAMMNEAAQQQPIKNLDTVANQDAEFLTCHHQQPTPAAVASGNDVDSVDVAAEWPWFDSSIRQTSLATLLSTRATLRLYPRPWWPSSTSPLYSPGRAAATSPTASPALRLSSTSPNGRCARTTAPSSASTRPDGSDRHRRQAQVVQPAAAAPAVLRVPPAAETCTLKLCYEPPNGTRLLRLLRLRAGLIRRPAAARQHLLREPDRLVSEIISSDIVGDPNQLRQSRSAARLVIDAAEDAFQPPDSLQLPPRLPVELAAEDSSGDNSSGRTPS
uniref:UDENN domain-containing protein n=1 Tax=Macrostomum lignano TaxID=282301 RepID=A0A1I8F610_9PLAT